MLNMDRQSFDSFSLSMRKRIVEIGLNSPYKSAHFGGALSSVEIVLYLFSSFLRLEKKSSQDFGRDRFVLSKGHACLALYSILLEMGFLEPDQICFEENGSSFAGHPVIDRNVFLDYSTGSLGNGLAYAIGAAISDKNRRVGCIVGDGEIAEGSTWEAIRFAPKYELDNLLLFLDNNKFQQTGSTDEINGSFDSINAFKSFGWDVIEIDGHSYDDFKRVGDLVESRTTGQPLAVVANTIKGRGVKNLENTLDSHHTVLKEPIEYV